MVRPWLSYRHGRGSNGYPTYLFFEEIAKYLCDENTHQKASAIHKAHRPARCVATTVWSDIKFLETDISFHFGLYWYSVDKPELR